MSRRAKEQHANHERWLVSYADFITLLFAFFVVMFASAQVDQRKAGKLAMAIQVAFQQLGVFPASNSKPPLSTTEPMPFSNVQVVDNVPSTTALAQVAPDMNSPVSIASGIPNLRELQKELEKALAPELERDEVAIKPHGIELVISLREIGFFDSGSATLRPGAEAPLARLAHVLGEQPYFLRVEGHTDSRPIHTARFASNWELSTARAIEIIALFISRYDLPAERLSAAGYAEYHPVAPNGTPEGRALNRRVDIVIAAPSPGSSRSAARNSFSPASRTELESGGNSPVQRINSPKQTAPLLDGSRSPDTLSLVREGVKEGDRDLPRQLGQ